jgi:hypothetical protein
MPTPERLVTITRNISNLIRSIHHHRHTQHPVAASRGCCQKRRRLKIGDAGGLDVDRWTYRSSNSKVDGEMRSGTVEIAEREGESSSDEGGTSRKTSRRKIKSKRCWPEEKSDRMTVVGR